jgi:hypothetical protein
MQLDLGNAGGNYYAGINNMPSYPVGLAITNNVVASGGDCQSGTPLQYGTNCFDQMSIITADPATPPTNPSSTVSGNCVNTSTSATIYLGLLGSATGYASAAAATTASQRYLNGDQLLLMSANGLTYTTIQLDAAGSTGTGAVAPNTNKFVALTSHTTTSTVAATPGLNTTSNDPYGTTTNFNAMLGQSFCSTDYVLRLIPITYRVDLTTPANPTLLRIVAGSSSTIANETIATQIIGFKIGASLFNNAADTDTTTYNFDASSYNNGTPIPYNYTFVRSVMVSLIGRTVPVTDPSYVFRNLFDGGAYQIQGVSMVVNPRNMSMSD